MNRPLPRWVRVRGGRPLLVAAVLLGALFSLASTSGAVGSPVDPVPAGVWPLQPAPRVVRGFMPPVSTWGAGHRGVDLAGSVGEAVHTALAGRVVFAGPLAGRGVVVVDHGATRTTYEPVASFVRVGQVLTQGQPLGTLELAGSHCSPSACLHWGWKRGHTYLDPLRLVGGGPIVLLPLGLPDSRPMFSPVVPSARRAPAQLVASRRPGLPSAVWRRPLAMRPLLM